MKNPTAVAALDLIRKHDGGPVCYDHFAFRTFGVSMLDFFVFLFLRRFSLGLCFYLGFSLLEICNSWQLKDYTGECVFGDCSEVWKY
jgi:hypothetical protein